MIGWFYVLVLLGVISTLAIDFRELGEEVIDPGKTGKRFLSERKFEVSLKPKPLKAPAIYFEKAVMVFAQKAINTVAVIKPSSPCSAEGYCYKNEVFCPVEEMRKTLPALYMSGGKSVFFISYLETLRRFGWKVSVSNLITCDGVYRFGNEEILFQEGRAVRYVRTGNVYVEILRVKRGDYRVFIENPKTGVALKALIVSYGDFSTITVEEVKLHGRVDTELRKELNRTVKDYRGDVLDLMINFTENPGWILRRN